ncbi:MAG TPA: four helix bundle protein [Anaerolineales bacterium]|jgi:four helix bundle protein
METKSKLPYAASYHDLLAYQQARQLAQDIFQATIKFPKEETYSLTSQIRRSSRAIGAQIAEAWAKRLYEKHFVSKLTDADGEQQETQHWIDTASDCGYINVEQATELKEKCAKIGRLLAGMMAKSHLFCNQSNRTLKETSTEYFAVNISDQEQFKTDYG